MSNLLKMSDFFDKNFDNIIIETIIKTRQNLCKHEFKKMIDERIRGCGIVYYKCSKCNLERKDTTRAR